MFLAFLVPHVQASDEAKAWPAADELFRHDQFWVGADGAYSVDLGDDRILWLFADTFIDPTGKGSRRSEGATIVGNTIAIEKGRDPSHASIEFHWRRAEDGTPRAFFPDVDGDRFWPGDAVKLGDRLLVFLMRVHAVKEGLGFKVTEWGAVIVEGLDSDPKAWKIRKADTPRNSAEFIVGACAVVVEGEYVWAYAPRDPGGTNVFLARFPLAKARDGDLTGIEWWAGEKGFLGVTNERDLEQCRALAKPVFEAASPEFTVHRDPGSKEFVQYQATGFGATDIETRHAPALEGPWSKLEKVYSPPEKAIDRVLLYQGKAHPELRGDTGGLVLTYCSNHLDFGKLVADDRLYFPRFVVVPRP